MINKSQFSTATKGMAMGMAEVIPGVSGGTIAFITGIYERLINVLKTIGPDLIVTFRKDGIKGVWRALDGNFITALVLGMGIGVGIGVFLITHLLENYPLHIWSFFFGLILVSAVFVGRQINEWNGQVIFMFTLGACGAYMITVAVPGNGNPALWFVFLSGVIAVSALMLPGISGSFILLLMGMYAHIIGSLKSLLETFATENLIVVLVFAAGMLVGMTVFSRVVSWAFKHYHNLTLAVLTGFLIGSLNKVWPWQEVLKTMTKENGEQTIVFSKSVLPSHFEQLNDNFLYGNEPHLVACLVLMIIGFFTVVLFEYAAKKLNQK